MQRPAGWGETWGQPDLGAERRPRPSAGEPALQQRVETASARDLSRPTLCGLFSGKEEPPSLISLLFPFFLES